MMLVSVIIPCRNESKYIGACLQSIVENDFPMEQLEVLVIDGMSEDETRLIVEGYAKRYPFITLLDNPKKITPVALNLGIAKAKGSIVMRMDAHATYEKNYMSQCVEALDKYGADNVGGIWKIVPRNNTLIGRGIVRALSHEFGVGNAHYRLAKSRKPRWVDTVPFFCLKREIFQKVGLFNESLIRGEDMEFSLRLKRGGIFNENLERGQDMEFSLRLKKAGGLTLLVPNIVSYYYARSDIKSFWKHNWSNGVWAIIPFLHSRIMPVSWRHLVPLFFVISLIGSAASMFLVPSLRWPFFTVVSVYGVANLAASVQIAWKERDLRYLVSMPLVFGMLHIGYGLGSLWGAVVLVGKTWFWKKLLGLEANYATAPE